MIPGIPRISVYIITYNQEDVIDRTLGSILRQKDYVYEICVSDDHSTDRTWEILKKYNEEYPGLFKLNRNNPNLGIFENTEKVWTMPTGDIVHDLAGDDCVGDGWFRTVIEFIKENGIDYKNDLFCIYGDYKSIYPSGDSFVFRNNTITKAPNQALRLSLRGIIGNRSCCYSINVLKKFEKVSKGRSHIAESAQDRQLQLFSKNNYYIPQIGNIYYANMGVSSHIDDNYQERLSIHSYALDFLLSKGFNLTRADINYAKFDEAFVSFVHSRSIKRFVSLLWTYLISRDFSLPHGNGYRRVIFALVRRFPHTKPIHFC